MKGRSGRGSQCRTGTKNDPQLALIAAGLFFCVLLLLLQQKGLKLPEGLPALFTQSGAALLRDQRVVVGEAEEEVGGDVVHSTDLYKRFDLRVGLSLFPFADRRS